MRAAWLLVTMALAGPLPVIAADGDGAADPAEVAIGERLFFETRFAQYFFAHSGGNVNAVLAVGDPVVATTRTRDGVIPGPFAGQSINCRACHMVDDTKDVPGGGSRSYADFARQSPIPARDDGRTTAPRNSPSLVNASLARSGPFVLHFDGEFPDAAALARGTLTGRNYGWLPDEARIAVAHIARVVREDDGTGGLAQRFGGSYRRVLGAVDPALPPEFRLAHRYRLDVDHASDETIVGRVARLIGAYVASLEFAQDDGAFTGSPYDRFLVKNHLPTKPDEHEPPVFYRARLRQYLRNLDAPDFVSADDGAFALHAQPFAFGVLELEGLRIFLDPARGNCAACHVPPAFTDFGFHNTGVAQLDYDATHGEGAFAALAIPDLAARGADLEAFLPPSAAHPRATEPFRALVDVARPGRVDLGLWNIYRNPAVSDRRHQRGLDRLVCASLERRSTCRRLDASARLDAAIAVFKTAGIRDLGHSAPYLHTGKADELADVVRLYAKASALAHAGMLRNAAPELRHMTLGETDIAPLAAFLRALDEDYE